MSIATPVFGVKVVFVAFLLTFVGHQRLPTGVWIAAALATLGIALIQWTGRGHPQRVIFTVLLALSAASCYATFDVLVQHWAPLWGAGRFLPIVYWMVGFVSLALIPWVDWPKLFDPKLRSFFLFGSLLIALQAVCIVVAVGVYGDAARVNVVYALRGLVGCRTGVGGRQEMGWSRGRVRTSSDADASCRSSGTDDRGGAGDSVARDDTPRPKQSNYVRYRSIASGSGYSITLRSAFGGGDFK